MWWDLFLKVPCPSLCSDKFSCLLTHSHRTLSQIEQTSIAVLNMFPDLELAVEVDEPQLALSFFEMVKSWVKELITLVATTQNGNQASISQVRGEGHVRI